LRSCSTPRPGGRPCTRCSPASPTARSPRYPTGGTAARHTSASSSTSFWMRPSRRRALTRRVSSRTIASSTARGGGGPSALTLRVWLHHPPGAFGAPAQQRALRPTPQRLHQHQPRRVRIADHLARERLGQHSQPPRRTGRLLALPARRRHAEDVRLRAVHDYVIGGYEALLLAVREPRSRHHRVRSDRHHRAQTRRGSHGPARRQATHHTTPPTFPQPPVSVSRRARTAPAGARCARISSSVEPHPAHARPGPAGAAAPALVIEGAHRVGTPHGPRDAIEVTRTPSGRL
jgi:hypothetical protein